MSLINCPECDKQISSKADNCPNCGYPIAQKKSVPDENLTQAPYKEAKQQLRIKCPKCKKTFFIKEEMLGQKINCPYCNSNINIASKTKSPINSTTIYCTNCGNKTTNNAYCVNCGAPPFYSKRYCYNCGSERTTNQIICIKCGVHFFDNFNKQYKRYCDLPWYRKSGVNSLFTLLGFFCFTPLLLIVCINCLTGDIYYDKFDDEGCLKKWHWANKLVAFILLILNILFLLAIIADM